VDALDLGACWAGDAGVMAPHALDAANLSAPQGGLVPTALRVDGDVIFALQDHVAVKTHVLPFAQADASHAIDALRRGAVDGAAVL